MRKTLGISIVVFCICPAFVAAQDIQLPLDGVDLFIEWPSSFPQFPKGSSQLFDMGLTSDPQFKTIIPGSGPVLRPEDRFSVPPIGPNTIVVNDDCERPTYCVFVTDPSKFKECICGPK